MTYLSLLMWEGAARYSAAPVVNPGMDDQSTMALRRTDLVSAVGRGVAVLV